MNFAQVQTAGDQLTTMFGVITEFKGEGVNPKSQKPYKKVVIVDDVNVKHNVTLRGSLPDVSILNQRVQFNLSSYQGTYEGQPYTGYSGFWNAQAQVAPQAPPQPAYTPPAQPAYTPPQPAYTPPAQPAYTPPAQSYVPVVPPKGRDFDKENRGKCRFGFYQAILQAGMNPAELVEDVPSLQAIEKLVEFSMEGNVPNVGPDGVSPVTEDDIPF